MGKRVALLMVCFIFVSAVIGCIAEEEITLKMWTFIDPTDESGRGKVIGNVIDEFEKEFPNVKIVTELQTWNELATKQIVGHFTDSAPDVMWTPYESIAGVIETGAYGALDDIVVKDWSETFINDIDDALWGSCTKDGKHYFVCIARSCYGFLYRKDFV